MEEHKELVNYFISETNKRIDRLETKVMVEFDDLKKFKYTWTGGLIVINALIGYVIAIYFGR